MKLGDLIADQPVALLHGSMEAVVTDISDDSRRISPGALFIARAGTQDDGAKYARDALARGAVAVVQCDAITMGRLAEKFYGNPSRKLSLIGVTGTNGKTTVAYMVRHLLNAMDEKCGLISTVEVDVGDTSGGAKPQAAVLTTPGSCELSRLLATMVDNGCQACVMECSSHALHQGRCDALDFDVAVFTNLTGDHLDYHGSMEEYAAAKARLFDLADVGVINLDDPWGNWMMRRAGDRAIGYHVGPVREGGLWNAHVLEASAAGTRLRLEGFDDQPLELTLPLIGRHNVYNLLAAVGVVNLRGAGVDAMKAHIETMPPVPGRLERVTVADAPFAVFVDYAHTDDALANVLGSLRPLVPTGGALRVLFGCGGDRDRTKRPRMAKIACDLADYITITSDNPRTEPPDGIITEVLAGVNEAVRDRVTTLANRREAIEQIIRSAGEGDIVLLAGKGHEDYQIIGTTKYPFDDRVIARTILQSTSG